MEATQTPPPQLIQLLLQCHARQQLYLVGSYNGHYFLLSLVYLPGDAGTEDLSTEGYSQATLRQAQCDILRQAQCDILRQAQCDMLRQAQCDMLRQAQCDTDPHPDTLREPQCDSLQEQIDNTLAQHRVPCTLLVLDINRFNRWLAEGHPFAWTLIKKAALVHDCGHIVATGIPSTPRYPSADKIAITTAFQYTMAKQFFDGAAFYRQKGRTDLAAFMLHQCTEQCLRALLTTTTGWCPHTHNLDKLLRHCSMTVHEVWQVFTSSLSSDRVEQARLYQLLRNAYVDARYKIYTVMDDDLRVLTKKVRMLMKLVRHCEGACLPLGRERPKQSPELK